MIRVIVLIAFIIYSFELNAQSWISSNRIDGSDNLTEIQSVIDSEGNVIVYGFFLGTISVQGNQLTSRGSRDYFVSRFLQTGELDWIQQFGGNSLEYVGGGICASSDGNIYVTGGFRSDLYYSENDSIESTGFFDIFLAKMNNQGDVIWCENIGKGAKNQRPDALKVNSSGDIILAGFFTDSIEIAADTTLYSNDGYDDFFYSSFTSDGEHMWSKQIKGISSPIWSSIYNISVLDDGYVMSGNFADSVVFEDDTIVSVNESYDIHLFKTDFSGKVQWLRKIQGDNYEYTFSTAKDPNNNIYIGGYYNSPSIAFDSTDTESVTINQNNGDYDIFIAKYFPDGTFDWAKTNGSVSTDKIYDLNFFDNKIHVGGLFSDVLQWGGIELSTNGTLDQDMFYGSLDLDGNYRSANSYSGRNNSSEEARAIFNDEDQLFTVIRSNSDLLVLGDSIYTSTTGKYYIVVGVIGCLPIGYDNVDITDIECNGDSTGIISVLASGGFGSPYSYSIDNGDTYQPNSGNFLNLPAGEYNLVVIDKENCTEPYSGNPVTITEPDPLTITGIDSVNVTTYGGNDGSISVTVSGGTVPYSYVMNDGSPQGTGNFTGLTAGKYLVKVDDVNECGPVETDSITITEPPNYVLNLNAHQLKIYPNPSSGSFTMEFSQLDEELLIEVFSMSGTRVYLNEFPAHMGAFKKILDLGSYGKGIYLLKLNGEAVTTRLVVQ